MCSTEISLKARVKTFVEDLRDHTAHWECLNLNLNEQYDFSKLSQLTGVVKYRFCKKVENLDAVILSTDGKTRRLEVVFADNKNVVYEVPYTDDFQMELERIESKIKSTISTDLNCKFTHIRIN